MANNPTPTQQDILAGYLQTDPNDPLSAYPIDPLAKFPVKPKATASALRRHPQASQPQNVEGQVYSDPFPSMASQEPQVMAGPQATASSSAPGINPGPVAKPVQPSDTKFTYADPEMLAATLDMAGIDAESANAGEMGALLESLRDKKRYGTGLGAGFAGAGNIMNAIQQKMNIEKRGDLAKDAQHRWLKYAAPEPSIQERGGEGY